MVLVLGSASFATAQVQFGEVITYKGICEPSGAVGFPAGTTDQIFIVANDETNSLKAYRAIGGEPLDMLSGDLNKFLQLDDKKDDNEADFEGAAWLNGRAYWIGSHSRSRKGNIRQARWQLFAARISVGSNAPVITPTSEKPFKGLLPAISALDDRLKAKINLGQPKEEELAPDNKGFNIEGLTGHADGKSLLLGLRSPLLGDKADQAVLIPLENPEGVVERNEQPILREPILLDLGGRGVRSMEYSAAARAYLIVAGPAGDDSGTFELYTWTGEKPSPTPVPGFSAALQKLDKFQPEAMVVDSTGKKIHLFSDDGDTCNKTAPAFRGVAITLP
ncbi:MAG TPA: DUF3616 domain-containing protein [Beijerinckiaceae bacterium]